MLRKNVVLALLASGLLSFVAACSSDTYEAEPQVSATGNAEAGGGGRQPPADLVSTFESLPTFPGAERGSELGTTGRELMTGYLLNDASLDEVLGYYEENLTKDGWRAESAPITEKDEKAGAISEFVRQSFLRDGIRLALYSAPPEKDQPPGTITVQLILAPEDLDLFPEPIGAPIDATPLPTDAPDTSPTPAGPPG